MLSLLKNDIILAQPVYIPTTEAPLVLPPQITLFVADSIGISEGTVDGCWNALKGDVWDYPTPEKVEEDEDALFAQNGWKRGISEL